MSQKNMAEIELNFALYMNFSLIVRTQHARSALAMSANNATCAGKNIGRLNQPDPNFTGNAMRLVYGGLFSKISTIAIVTSLTLLYCHGNAAGDIVTVGSAGGLSHVYDPLNDPDPWDLGNATLVVGNSSQGFLFVDNGSDVLNGSGTIGNQAGVTGTVNIDGSGTTWTNSGSLVVGQSGTGSMTVEGGGVVDSSGMFIAASNGTGTAEVTGTGSQWNGNTLSMGGSSGSNATLDINSNGAVTSSNSTIASGSGTNADVVVETGATWTNSGALTVGRNGTGDVNVNTGGVVSTTFTNVGLSTNGTGTVSVDGSGSQWNNSDEIVVGASSNAVGTINASNGGFISSNRTRIANSSSTTGTVTINGSGSHWNNTSDMLVGGSSTAAGGNGTLNIENDGLLSVGTTLKVWDTGTVKMNGGDLTVFQLDLSDTTSASAFQMNDGRLTVEFGITGTLVQDGGVLTSGSTLFSDVDVAGDLVMNDGIIEFRLDENYAFDLTGNALLDGTMDVNFMMGFDPMLNDTFQLIDANSYSTNNGSVMFDFTDATLDTGLGWDTSTFLSDGTIRVVGVAVPEPGSLALLVTATVGLVARRRRN